ncbi:MAG: glycoside hydrolase family 97 protein [Saprospiraceae bacterium]|nr:glycoside hydrolase family 97 protein [Saprospiraceae bacterium]MBP7699147.1 glycoside hydrolase family 97 protein [Saprospiraceae bacterium]
MYNTLKLVLLLAIITFSAHCKAIKNTDNQQIILTSPNKDVVVQFALDKNGSPYYTVQFQHKMVVAQSYLGFETKDGNYANQFKIKANSTSTFDETWTPVWGQYATIRNHYNELKVTLANKQKNKLNIIFRAYDYGIGFRYEFPNTASDSLFITDEKTQFHMTADHDIWWIPGCWENDEYPYSHTRLSAMDNGWYKEKYQNVHARYIPDQHSVNTPATMKADAGFYVSIHEAALVNFPGMSLAFNPTTFTFKSNLAEADNAAYKAVIPQPFQTPWRTILLANKAGDLIEHAYLIENLNEPCKITNTDFIKPTKYLGIWWEMHLGNASWNYTETEELRQAKNNLYAVKPHGKHGATTANAKRYIDACKQTHIPALLIEGWNTGWEYWQGDNDREGIFDFTTPYPDFDINEVVAYAKANGIAIIGHHETAAAVKTYETRLDTAMKFYHSLGIHAVKSGYVGKIKGHRHYDQYMVNHYNKVMETAAQYQLMLDVHEPIKPTGLCRTYPNLVSSEGMRGMEFNAWTEGNKTDHNVTLPFTRNLAGAMDYTPGILDIQYKKTKNKDSQPPYQNAIRNTLANQMALYVLFYSPIQMVADLPENLTQQHAMEFITQVPTDWEDTKVINAEIGEYITIARKEKGSQDKWFIGSATNEVARNFSISLDFLPKGKNFIANIYADGKEAHWDKNPYDLTILKREVNAKTNLNLRLGAGGGCAIMIEPTYE